MRLTLGPLLLAGLVACTSPAVQAQTWPIDAARSQAQFSVRKLLFAHVRGTFPRLQGVVRRIDTHIDADLAEVDATIDIAALQMQDPKALAHALGPNFFDAARYPYARFASDPFPVDTLATGGSLRGFLTLRGIRQPVTLTLAPSECPRQPLQCVVRVHGRISRTRFGMHTWRGVLADAVELDLRIRLAMPGDP